LEVKIAKTITPEQAKKFYNRFGRLQDTQRFYEDSATHRLIELADFGNAQNVLEFGCGTGHFAQRLFSQHLSSTAHYTGIDISPKMLDISADRLKQWQSRIELKNGDISLLNELSAQTYDRFVCNYVLDLLSEEAITEVLQSVHRLLTADGLLCLVSLTYGTSRFSRLLTGAWQKLHGVNPVLLGGCRPLRLQQYLSADLWKVQHQEILTAYGLASEVVIAAKF
jgi:ubiquinone/menaquinone biosynthesis C-methylase UbiE